MYQFYTRRGFDATFMAIYQALIGKPEVAGQALPDSYCRKLHVPVSRYKALRGCAKLSIAAVIELNQMVELYIRDLIRDSFQEEIASCRRNDVKFRIKPFIDGILERMGFSEDAKSYDAVAKDLQRFCKAQGIEYKEEKKVRKAVPKLTRTIPTIPTDGIPWRDFLKYKGISKNTYFRRYRKTLETFKHRGRVYIKLESLPAADLSFIVPKH